MPTPPPAATLDPNAAAAHHFLAELRTRITTQPLPYQHGTEARALESLWEVFAQARTAMQKYPGCEQFSAVVTDMLNVDLRPVTAKWHRAFVDGRLNSRDGGDEFRADLAKLQPKLQRCVQVLSGMAYGSTQTDRQTPPVMSEEDMGALFRPIAFGLVRQPLVQQPLVPPETVDAINASERTAVQDRRAKWRAKYSISPPEGADAFGLALSGGGIRSATFALGAVQVLAEQQILRQVDFLSTVSGGGYTGCFLTTRLGAGTPEDGVAHPDGPDPDQVRYLRHHAKYLAAANLWQSWSMVTATLAGMLLNWSAPVFLILVLALAAILVGRCVPWWPGWTVLLSVLGGLTGLALVIYGWGVRRSPGVARATGWVLAVLLAVTLASVLGWSHMWLKAVSALFWPATWTLPAIFAAVVAVAPAILRFVPILRRPVVRRIVLQVALVLAGLIVPVMAVALFHAALLLGAQDAVMTLPAWAGQLKISGIVTLGGLIAILGFVAIFLLNINLTAPHRLYRDMLAVAFVQPSETDAEPILFQAVNPLDAAPYHIVNATVNVPANTEPRLRDRKSDFFMFSKHWCGSPVTGYDRTEAWTMAGKKVDLASAMAISGAAASSYMGLQSQPALTALLTFLNLRLGFWIRRPGGAGFLSAPGFLRLMQEMTGIGMSEKGPWFNLSDGGHIENIGVYELLRRRCKYIVCVDGEADPDYTFPGLMTLVRHAQLDFGVRIDLRLNALRPDPATHLSQAHGTLGRIHYPATADGRPKATGLLLYLKLSLTGNETELIHRYRTVNPDFPHQTTLDQFYGEEQFEAYRQLGVHVMRGLFARSLMVEPLAPERERSKPVDVADWFYRLAANLLEPETNDGPDKAPASSRFTTDYDSDSVMACRDK